MSWRPELLRETISLWGMPFLLSGVQVMQLMALAEWRRAGARITWVELLVDFLPGLATLFYVVGVMGHPAEETASGVRAIGVIALLASIWFGTCSRYLRGRQ